MKKILLILTIIGSTLFLNSCRKDDNPKLPDLTRVPVPLLTLAPNSNLIIQDNDEKASFKSTFNADVYFKDDVKPQKYDIVVTKNGDYKNVKVYSAGLTALPSAVEVTLPRLAELFGLTMDDVIPGTFFEVRMSFTLQNGTVVPAFSTIGQTYGTDLNNLAGASLTLKYQVVCGLDMDTFTGQFMVYDVDGFWEEDYLVTLSNAGENKVKVSGFVGQPTAEFIIDVDPINRTVNVPKQIYGPGTFLFGYNNFAIAGRGEIDACNNTILFNGAYTVDEGNFGSYPVRMVKVQ